MIRMATTIPSHFISFHSKFGSRWKSKQKPHSLKINTHQVTKQRRTWIKSRQKSGEHTDFPAKYYFPAVFFPNNAHGPTYSRCDRMILHSLSSYTLLNIHRISWSKWDDVAVFVAILTWNHNTVKYAGCSFRVYSVSYAAIHGIA